MLEIALVADEHDDDFRVRVVAELLQPPCYVDVRRVLGDVVDEERADCATVVSGYRMRGRRLVRRAGSGDDKGLAYAAVMAR